MKNCIGKLCCSLTILLILAPTGCSFSEREAARRIDFTAGIIEQASEMLAADRDLGRFHLQVDGFRGQMWVKGQVRTAAQKDRAARIVWTVPRVRLVQNLIEVTGTPAAGK